MVARTKTSRHRPIKRPKVATLFCAEGLRAQACVVVDALAVRGWSVQLQTGDAAREALKRFRDPSTGIRVLCLPEPLDVASQQALRRALDPLGRGDLLIVDFFTPRSVVENVLKFGGYRVGPRRPRTPRRTTRSYLAQPTLIEHAVDVGYWSRYGVGAAAAGVAILGGMSTFWAMRPDVRPVPAAAAVAAERAPQTSAQNSPLVEQTALSNTHAVPDPDPVLSARPRAPVPAEPIPEEPAEPQATLEEIALPEVPVEGLVAIERPYTPPVSISRGGAPGLPRAPHLGTLDPFGTRATPR
ncbi:MAG: hypothetical protein ACE37F_12215 [Nannocystaceae bacterium]|nr:hypothetical protein [bacterium]